MNTANTHDLDQRMERIWDDRRTAHWSAQLGEKRVEQYAISRRLASLAPSTRWGHPSPEQVETLVQAVLDADVVLLPHEVAVRGRFPVPGVASLDDWVEVAIDTLIVGDRHYDLTPEQSARLKAQSLRWQERDAHERSRMPNATEQAELDAIRERFQLQAEMAALPTVPDLRRRSRSSSRHRRGDGDSGLGAAIGSNSFGSWG